MCLSTSITVHRVVSSSNQRLKASSQLGPAMTMIPPGISFTVRERSTEVFDLEHRGLVPISLNLRKTKRDREMGDDRFIDAVPDTTRSLNFQAIDVNELKKGWSYPLRKQTRVLQPSWSFSLPFPFLRHAWIMMFCLFAWVSIGALFNYKFLIVFFN